MARSMVFIGPENRVECFKNDTDDFDCDAVNSEAKIVSQYMDSDYCWKCCSLLADNSTGCELSCSQSNFGYTEFAFVTAFILVGFRPSLGIVRSFTRIVTH